MANRAARPAITNRTGNRPGTGSSSGGGRVCRVAKKPPRNFARLCKGMQPGEGKFGACIRDNLTNLSMACQQSLIALRGQGARRRP